MAVAFVTSMLAMIMFLVVAVQSQKCPDKPGYVTKADTNWVASSKTQESQTRPPANAEQICNLDANCLAWNSFGYYILKKDSSAQPTIAATDIKLAPYTGLCTYIKATALPAQCPDKAGYIAKADTNWAASSKAQESQTQPANAEQICNLDANCLAWNSFGYYVLKKDSSAQPTIAATNVKLLPYTGLCTYIKATAMTPQCPDKAGYTTNADTNWVATANSQESQTQPANAEQICNLDANCLAWNSFGYYILRKGNVAPTMSATGIKFQPYTGMCTYVKQSATQQQAPAVVVPPTQQQQQQQATPQQLPLTGAVPQPTLVVLLGGQPQQQARGVAFRNAATKLCLAANDADRLLLGTPRLSQAPCNPRDASQAFRVVQAGNMGVQITDNKGRCLTAFEGLLVDTTALAACGRARADQLWSLNGQSALTIKSRAANRCIANERRLLSLDACNPNDANALFEPLPL